MARRNVFFFVFLGFLFVPGLMHCSKPKVTLCYETSDCPKTAAYVCVLAKGICELAGSEKSGSSEKGAGDGGSSGRCETGQRRSCYTGPQSTRNKGGCRPGEQLCVDDVWGDCVGQNVPEKEVCDGRDNDCNGQIDETCHCKPGEAQACYTGPRGTQGQGVCTAGIRICQVSKKWGPCQDQKIPQEEQCDSLDNNCNGAIDEGCVKCSKGQKRLCYTGPAGTGGVGLCKKGTQTCNSTGKWGVCNNQIFPDFERCDKKDNDCNGKVDDACKVCKPGTWRPCYSSIPGIPPTKQPCTVVTGKWVCKGICYTGRQYCSAGGSWLDCAGMLLPRAEDCNGKDDDCDGQTDEGLSPPLCNPVAKGACIGAVKRCDSKRGWLPCTIADYQRQNSAYEKLEKKCDGKDNDCNGRVDENCANLCTPGKRRSCYDGTALSRKKGICKDGIQTCGSNKKWGACIGQVLPRSETCNKIDDDCDGFVDEAYPQQGQACKTNRPGICATGFWACQSGKLTCPPSYQPRVEICNGRDDNCNGKIDDGAAQYTFYKDSDGDNYGDIKSPIKACAPPPGYVSNSKDCYDKNAMARPGQFAFFVNHRGDGSFDYNCDGKQSQRYTKPGSCNNCKSAVIDIGFLQPSPACGKTGRWVERCRFDVGKCSAITISKRQECR